MRESKVVTSRRLLSSILLVIGKEEPESSVLDDVGAVILLSAVGPLKHPKVSGWLGVGSGTRGGGTGGTESPGARKRCKAGRANHTADPVDKRGWLHENMHDRSRSAHLTSELGYAPRSVPPAVSAAQGLIDAPSHLFHCGTRWQPLRPDGWRTGSWERECNGPLHPPVCGFWTRYSTCRAQLPALSGSYCGSRCPRNFIRRGSSLFSSGLPPGIRLASSVNTGSTNWWGEYRRFWQGTWLNGAGLGQRSSQRFLVVYDA